MKLVLYFFEIFQPLRWFLQKITADGYEKIVVISLP